MKNAIAQRVSPFCRGMNHDDFDAMVERMALIEIKYSMRRQEFAVPRATGAHS